MLDLDELKKLHDKAYNQGTVTRERAADDLVFYWVTQWDDNLLGEAQLQYRGEFNILRKAGRQIIQDLRANPVQIDFQPKADARDDGADLIDGLYLTDDRLNTTLEAYTNCVGETVVCGVGAWELYTEYESNRIGNENQVIRRRPLYEANNNVFWDPNAKLLDKSDANYVSILTAYSHDGYKELVKELTGEEITSDIMDSFKNPEESYSFPWAAGQNKHIYVSTFYHREKVKDKIHTVIDLFGQPMLVRDSDMTEVMDELIDTGYQLVATREFVRWQITKYVASGERILATYAIAGENIPVVPMYGERAFVEGEEHYEGVTRLSKDPQRLRNFQMSYLADIVSRSPRPKPIFNPEQIQGFEFMYEENGADNNYPYLLQRRMTTTGETLPQGPVAQMPEQKIPDALIASLDLSRQAVEDVANPGLPQDIADPDLSGKAVLALQARLDQQSMVYQENLKHAKRRDAEIYVSMAIEVYDAPRNVTLTNPDGSRNTASIMETVMDKETGEMVTLNDLSNAEFDVYAEIGPSYTSKKEQTLETLGNMATSVAANDPAMHKMLVLKMMTFMDGVNMDDVREYANKQLVLSGFKPPENEEEEAILAQAQQAGSEPDAATILAYAEDKKAQAQMLKEQRQAVFDQAKIENERAKTNIDIFEAQTDRIDTQIEAQKAGAEINYKNIHAFGQQLDNAAKIFGARVNSLG